MGIYLNPGNEGFQEILQVEYLDEFKKKISLVDGMLIETGGQFGKKYSTCAVGCSKEHPTHSFIRKIRADALLCLLKQTHFAH